MQERKSIVSIIGGSGFVGSRLTQELVDYEFVIIDKNISPVCPNKTVISDIRFPENITLNKYSKTIILLAAEHRDDVTPTSLYYNVNVDGTRNVLEKMDELGIKNLIFTSSVAVYGLNKKNPSEIHQKEPFNHYGKSKWAAEQVIKEWYNKNPKDKSVVIIRPTVIFGERNRGNVYNLLKQISSGKFLMIGKGHNKKSMAYVGNVAAFIKDRIENRELGYHVYNYADKPDFTMSELATVIEDKMKITIPKIKIPYWLGMVGGFGFDILAFLSRKKLSVSSVRVKKFCATTQFDASKAHSIFKAPYTLEEGLNKTLKFEFIDPNDGDEIVFFSE
jgi:GlcNAc-P-P-Und epimerase